MQLWRRNGSSRLKKRRERKDGKLSRTTSGLPLQLPEGQSDAIKPQHLSDADSSAIRGHPWTPPHPLPTHTHTALAQNEHLISLMSFRKKGD